MFSLNEKVVYPGHGVARVNRIIERCIAGKKAQFFELTFLHKDMTILVPIDTMNTVGIRPLSTQTCINELLDTISHYTPPNPNEPVANWNKRHKGYQEIIRRGNLHEISIIYRDLKYIETQKELSFGEKSLLAQTEELLTQEIALVKNVQEEIALMQLRALVSSIQSPHSMQQAV